MYEQRLRTKIEAALKPAHLELVNESPNHGLPASAEKHFRAIVVADEFLGLSRIDRHRRVQDVVAEELREHVHAFSVQAFTPEEWSAKGGETFASPECLGGGKREGVGRK
jgi:BolA protein